MTLHLLTAICEIALAIALLHRASIVLRSWSHWRAWKVWFLAAALMGFGIGQIDAWLGVASISPTRMFGDAALIIYAAWRLVHILRHLPPPHWSDT